MDLNESDFYLPPPSQDTISAETIGHSSSAQTIGSKPRKTRKSKMDQSLVSKAATRYRKRSKNDGSSSEFESSPMEESSEEDVREKIQQEIRA